MAQKVHDLEFVSAGTPGLDLTQSLPEGVMMMRTVSEGSEAQDMSKSARKRVHRCCNDRLCDVPLASPYDIAGV